MKWHRVLAVVVRHGYNFKHSWDKISDAFYWPAMDILLWGLTSSYVLKGGGNIPNIVMMLLSGLVYWQIVWRSQYEITTNLLEELWARNMVNFFASPLRLGEWIAGVVVLGIFKMLVTAGFAAGLAYVLYAVNVFSVGWYFIPFLVSLLLTGWFVGFLVSGIIISYGTRIQTLAWAGVYILAPFSGIYYPLSTLPHWARMIAKFVPTSYVFEGMRMVLLTGRMPVRDLGISYGLNLVYLLFSLALFVKLFELRRRRGLAQLE